MKWIVRGASLLVLLVLMLAVFSQAQSGTFARVNTDRINIRTGPGIEYEIIGQAFFGNTFPVIERSLTGNWLHVDLGNGTTGWLFRPLVTEINSSGSPVVGNPALQGSNLGQGGGAAPQDRLGQGGGALPAPSPSTVLTVDLSAFNSTIGVFANVNMRIGPGTNFRVIWVLPYDQRAVPIARNATGSWILVQYNGYEGWVSSRYVVAPPAIDLAALPVR